MRVVQNTPCVARVAALPRRRWSEEQAAALATRLTERLRAPGGVQTLRPIQAIALKEIVTEGGALLPIRVGGGKTLISLLAATVTRAKRPILLVPAHLKTPARLAEIEEYRTNWKIPLYVRIESYQLLSTARHADMLEEYKPDLIIADECQYLKNPRAACTRRVRRYLNEHALECRFVGMSGSLIDRGLSDFAHLAVWALHQNAPVPLNPRTVDEWGLALDCLPPAEAHRRMDPGPLVTLGRYRDRLVETPGVVSTTEPPLPIKLTITGELLDAPEPVLDAMTKLRATWETPDGHPFADGIAMWRQIQELALGYWSRWNPRPPDDWLEPRRAWASTCRHILSRNRRNLDTELQVVEAVDAGFYEWARPVLEAWREIRDTFEPNTEAVWISDHAVRYAAEWMRRGPGIVWTAHKPFGLRFGDLYYGGLGRNPRGDEIEHHPPGAAMIASVKANSSGRNLQAWNRNLIMSAPPKGKDHEQLLGRTHRPGQRAPEVTAHYVFGCLEAHGGFWRAVELSAYAEEMTGSAQKLTHAVLDVPETTPETGPQWTKAK